MNKNSPKNRVTFFLPSLEGGGAEKVTTNLVSNLNKSEIDYEVVLERLKGVFIKKIPSDVSLVSLDTSNLFSTFIKLIRYFISKKPDIFISSFSARNVIVLVAAVVSFSKTRIIVCEHTTFSLAVSNVKGVLKRFSAKFFLPLLMKIFYKRAELIVCVSKGVADDLVESVGYKDKMEIVYNPIVEEKINILSREEVEEPWFTKRSLPKIMAVGRLIKAKDYENLIKAFSLVCKEVDSMLFILGEGEERKFLEKLAYDLGIDKRIIFLGFKENPYKYMSKATVFVVSSWREGFHTALVEAMACGVPVVSTDCKSGPNEVIESGVNGLLVPIRNHKSLAEAIIKLLKDEKLRKKFSEEAKKTSEFFSVEKSLLKYKKILDKLLIKKTNERHF